MKNQQKIWRSQLLTPWTCDIWIESFLSVDFESIFSIPRLGVPLYLHGMLKEGLWDNDYSIVVNALRDREKTPMNYQETDKGASEKSFWLWEQIKRFFFFLSLSIILLYIFIIDF
jgi:hypothetical protein